MAGLRRVAGVVAMSCIAAIVLAAGPASALGARAGGAAALSHHIKADSDVVTVPLYRYEANSNLCELGCNPYLPPAYWSTNEGNGTSVPGTPYDLDPTVTTWIAPSQLRGTIPLYDCGTGVSLSGGGGGTSVNGYMNSLEKDCDDNTVNGIDGYIYDSPQAAPTGTKPVKLYQCEAQLVIGGDLFMTTASSSCEGVAGYSLTRALGWGLSSSYDYTTAGQTQTGTTSEGGCSPGDYWDCLTLDPINDPGQIPTTSIVPPGTPCEGGVESGDVCVAYCQMSATNGCGTAVGTFINLPPVTLPEGDSVYTPELYDSGGNLVSPATLVVGDATTAGGGSGVYSSAEADFVYTVLSVCTQEAGFSPPDFSDSHEPADSLGQVNDPSGFFSLSDSQIEAGTLTWVPPECEQWYADAPQVYDDFFVQNLGSSILELSGVAATNGFSMTSFENLAGVNPTSSTTWAGFLGTDCGPSSTATWCNITTADVAGNLLPYELAMGQTIDSAADGWYDIYDEMKNAVNSAANVIGAEYSALNFIQKGCGSGQTLVINPVIDPSTTTEYGLWMSIEGSGDTPGTLECILPSKACQENLVWADKSLNNMDAFLANPGLDPSSKSVSVCSYSVQVSDVGAQVESFDNVDEVGATGQGNAEWALSFGPPPTTSEGSGSNATDSAGNSEKPDDTSASDLQQQLRVQAILPFEVSTSGSAGVDTPAVGQAETAAVSDDTRTPSQTSVVSASSATPAAGSFDHYTATVTGGTNPTGTVTFTDNDGVICQDVPVATNGTAECVAQVGNTGTHTIVAGYSGDSLLAPSVSPLGVDILAGPSNQTIAFSPIFAQQAPSSLNLSSYATASSGLPLTFSVSPGSSGVCSVNGGTLTLTGAGTCTVLANQGGNENYAAAAQVSQSFAVSTSSLSITMYPVTNFTGSNENLLFSSTVTNTGSTELDNVSVTSSDGGQVFCNLPAIPPGYSDPCIHKYITTSADEAAGSFTTAETVQATNPTNQNVTASVQVTSPLQLEPGIYIGETVNQNDFTATGQTLDYSYTVANSGNQPLSNVSVGDNLGVTCPQSTLAIGAQETCTASHTTTPGDVAAGVLSDSAVASGTSPGGTVVTDPSNDTLYYVGIALSDLPQATQFNSEPFPVSFDDVVTNTSGVPLTGIAVIDESDSLGASCPDSTLSPGQSETCTYTHTSSVTDVSGGAVDDHAEVTATATLPSGDFVPPPLADATATVPYSAPAQKFKSADHFATTPGTKVSVGVKVKNKKAAIWAANVPPGMTFTDAANGVGTLTGTPTAGAGNYPIYLTAEGTSGAGEQTLSLDVDAFTSAAKDTFTSGQANSFTVSAVGGAPGEPVGFTVNQAQLPAGVMFTDNGDQTATLSGIPDVATKTTYKITITLNDPWAPNGSGIAAQKLKLVVLPSA